MNITISSRAKVLAALGILVLAGAGATLAAFTDTGNVETRFTVGTLDLKFDDDQDGNPVNYAVDFSAGFDNLAPGDTVERDLLVYNSGTIDALLSLEAPVITNDAGSPTPAVETFVTVVITDTTTGSELFSGPLASATFDDLGIGSGTANGHTLKLAVTLVEAAPTSVAGQSISVVLPFDATQS